jgi:hypothetical protein
MRRSVLSLAVGFILGAAVLLMTGCSDKDRPGADKPTPQEHGSDHSGQEHGSHDHGSH